MKNNKKMIPGAITMALSVAAVSSVIPMAHAQTSSSSTTTPSNEQQLINTANNAKKHGVTVTQNKDVTKKGNKGHSECRKIQGRS